MTGTVTPKVSIGLLVYNGQRYLRRALDSHLAQTFQDFELVITDNASTDDTELICKEYAESDGRIYYHRNPQNMGAMWNHNRCYELARGLYFKWSAHDDLMEPTFLERCVAVLDADPRVVLCHTLSKVVDDDMRVLAEYDPSRLATGSTSATTRFGARIRAPRCIEIFGLIRRDALARVRYAGATSPPDPDDPNAFAPFRRFVGADRPVLAELAADGRFACVPEFLFYNGEHGARSTALGKSPLDRLAFYRPVKEGDRSFPIWSLFRAYVDITHRRFPRFGDRLRGYGHIVGALFCRFNILRMVLELVNAVAPGLAPLITRCVTSIRRTLGMIGYRKRSDTPLKIK